MSMKISKYTFLLPHEDDCTAIYNCRTEGIGIIKNELANLVVKCKDNLEAVKSQNASFYDFLVRKQFAVLQMPSKRKKLLKHGRNTITIQNPLASSSIPL